MALIDDLKNDVNKIANKEWKSRKGRKVPSTAEITLFGGSVELEAAFLYADLAHSSKIAKEFDRRVAAKILKSFLATTARIVKNNGGVIVSFDGDRILGVFVGETKCTSAVKSALQINFTVSDIVRPKFRSKYASVKSADFSIEHGVGVDCGTVLAVRAGARGDSDSIWIGRAPNLAAKLSDIREYPYSSFITATVYNKMGASVKTSGGGNDMWQNRTWSFLDQNISIYRSNWKRSP